MGIYIYIYNVCVYIYIYTPTYNKDPQEMVFGRVYFKKSRAADSDSRASVFL